MRTIKFRGKNYDGMWMYGYLMPIKSPIHLDCKYGISVSPSALKSVDRILYEVETNTIGQFTGLKDKNGKDIYEGDIVAFVFQGKNVRSEVAWSEDAAMFFFKQQITHLFSSMFAPKFTIIGNIHDNKELLTEKKKRYE